MFEIPKTHSVRIPFSLFMVFKYYAFEKSEHPITMTHADDTNLKYLLKMNE